MRVRLSAEANTSLQSIRRFAKRQSEESATRLLRRLTGRFRQIAAFPLSGRIVPEFGAEQVREVIESPYRIWYLVGEEEIIILAIVHSAMDTRP